MMRAVLIAIIVGLSVLYVTPTISGETSVDFGKAAATGQEAFDGIRARSKTLHLAMACGNELDFARRFAFSQRFGKEGEDPATPFIEKDFASVVSLK